MTNRQDRKAEVSASTPDWTREAPRRWWDPSRRLLLCLRKYQAAKAKGGLVGLVFSKFFSLRHRFWSVITQADVPLNCQIEGGLKLPHPNGVVIHPGAIIGPNCAIFQQVTLGTSGTGSGLPVIGGAVDIGAGAKVLGPVTIGDYAMIGANSVVTKDVPEGAIVVGAPARIIGER